VNGGEALPSVRDIWPVSNAKNRASELLEQARRQHALALASLQAERELYQQLGEQLTVMNDPASIDLEIAAIGLKAGRDVSQADEEAARARRAQLQAERQRDHVLRLKDDADAAAEQFAADTELAALAEQTSEFERLRDERADELARLETAHKSALDAEWARAKRAEDDLDALRADPGR
jgi:hypothetical protein